MFDRSLRLTLLLVAPFALEAFSATGRSSSKEHYEKGLSAYKVQDWATATIELKLAYELDPRKEYLFALGQAQRFAGDCDAAIISYRTFLSASTKKQPQVEALIKRCEVLLEEAKTDDAPVDPQREALPQSVSDEPRSQEPPGALREETKEPEPPRPASDEPGKQEPHHALAPEAAERNGADRAITPALPARSNWWYQDAVGGTMFVLGLAAAGFGAAFLATDTPSNPPFWAALSRADIGGTLTTGTPLQLTAMGCVAGGTLLVVGSILRYVVVGLMAPTVTGRRSP